MEKEVLDARDVLDVMVVPLRLFMGGVVQLDGIIFTVV